MFALAILIGIYSYLVFALGISGNLYRERIFIITVIFILFILFFCRIEYKRLLLRSKKQRVIILLVGIIILQATINLVGTLGPEISFDALWYHLTLPKIFLQDHAIHDITGGLFYYSDMPKLVEMLYIPALAFGSEILAKTIHFLFGIACLVALYKVSRKFLNHYFSLLICCIFYANLVVGWESITAYVDLGRTFFEIVALWGFVNYLEKRERKWLIESAVVLGLAISAKLIGFGSLLIFSGLVIIAERKSIKNLLIGLFVYWVIGILIPLPWFVFSYVNTRNPVYPFFTNLYKTNFPLELFNPVLFVSSMFKLFLQSADPISPLYVIVLPLIILLLKNFSRNAKYIVYYCLLAVIVWYVTPQTGGGRFFLPYLPAFSVLVGISIKEIKNKRLQKFFIAIVLFVSFMSIIYRGVANEKFIPVLFGTETKSEFLSKHLNFNFGDFYDTDGYFAKAIKPNGKVLLYGFHNLYYIDFPFIDSSYIKTGDKFTYIAVQNSTLPSRFKNWNPVYHNPKTHVTLYSLGGAAWIY